MKYEDVSYNFKIAKIFAIFMVVTGHYFINIHELIWIPTTFGLFVFAFSSGFFISKKYKIPFDCKIFWYKKLKRLLYPVFCIDLFLFILFLIQGKKIFVWHTLPSLLGLNGFLNWFGVKNQSAFGYGLWFFTLLILFYVAYPLIAKLNKNYHVYDAFIVSFLLLTTLFHYIIPMDHMLWLTMFAFVLGGYWGDGYRLNIAYWLWLLVILISFSTLLYVNIIFHNNYFNYILILIISISLIGILTSIKFQFSILDNLLPLSNRVIYVYFIHKYLFFSELTRSLFLNYCFSLIIIIMTSYILDYLTNRLRTYIEGSVTYCGPKRLDNT